MKKIDSYEQYTAAVKSIAADYSNFFNVEAHEEGFDITPSQKYRLHISGADIVVNYIDKTNLSWKGIYVADCSIDDYGSSAHFSKWANDTRFEEFIDTLLEKLDECTDRLIAVFLEYDSSESFE